MPYRGKGTFDTGNISWGGYFSARLAGNINLEINNAITSLKITISFDASKTYFRNGSVTGAGFWNASVIGWADKNDLFAPMNGIKKHRYGLRADQDTESNAIADIRNHLTDSRWDDVFIGVAADDRYGSAGATHYWKGGNPAGKTYTKTYSITPELMVDQATGKFRNIYPLFNNSRAYIHDDPETGQPLPVDGCWVHTKYEQINGLPPTIEDLEWDYYPWAIKISNQWKSCNRLRAQDAHDPSKASYRMKKSSNWTDCFNNIYKPLNQQHGYIKTSNKWNRQQITGEEN